MTTIKINSTYSVVAQITTAPSQCIVVSADPNGNHDSGYAPSNVEDIMVSTSTPPGSPHRHRERTDSSSSTLKRSSLSKRNGLDGSPKREPLR